MRLWKVYKSDNWKYFCMLVLHHSPATWSRCWDEILVRIVVLLNRTLISTESESQWRATDWVESCVRVQHIPVSGSVCLSLWRSGDHTHLPGNQYYIHNSYHQRFSLNVMKFSGSRKWGHHRQWFWLFLVQVLHSLLPDNILISASLSNCQRITHSGSDWFLRFRSERDLDRLETVRYNVLAIVDNDFVKTTGRATDYVITSHNWIKFSRNKNKDFSWHNL